MKMWFCHTSTQLQDLRTFRTLSISSSGHSNTLEAVINVCSSKGRTIHRQLLLKNPVVKLSLHNRCEISSSFSMIAWHHLLYIIAISNLVPDPGSWYILNVLTTSFVNTKVQQYQYHQITNRPAQSRFNIRFLIHHQHVKPSWSTHNHNSATLP